MYTQVEKPKEKKSRAVANSVAQKKNNVKQGFGFVDRRSQLVVQQNLQKMPSSISMNSHVVQLNQAVGSKHLDGLFNDLKLIYVEDERMDFPMPGMCEVRAKIIENYLKDRDLKTKQFKLTYPPDSGWGYHIATGVMDESGSWWVMDTSFTDRPLIYTDWAKLMYQKKTKEAVENQLEPNQIIMLEALSEFLDGLQDVGDPDYKYPDNFNETMESWHIDLQRLQNNNNDEYFEKLLNETKALLAKAKIDTTGLTDDEALKNVAEDKGKETLIKADIDNLLLQIRKILGPRFVVENGVKRRRLR